MRKNIKFLAERKALFVSRNFGDMLKTIFTSLILNCALVLVSAQRTTQIHQYQRGEVKATVLGNGKFICDITSPPIIGFAKEINHFYLGTSDTGQLTPSSKIEYLKLIDRIYNLDSFKTKVIGESMAFLIPGLADKLHVSPLKDSLVGEYITGTSFWTFTITLNADSTYKIFTCGDIGPCSGETGHFKTANNKVTFYPNKKNSLILWHSDKLEMTFHKGFLIGKKVDKRRVNDKIQSIEVFEYFARSLNLTDGG